MTVDAPAVVTFDCYGTLIDWEAGIADAFAELLPVVDREAVLRLHAEIEPRVQAEGYRSYRDVLIETAWRTSQELGLALGYERCRFLPDSLSRWKPFPDTNAALARLVASGVRLGILSNVDDDLLAGTLGNLAVEFELLVTAEQLRSYKPAPAHFLEARRRVGKRPWLHAAQSYFHDVEPAAALGIPVAWINRKHEPAGAATRPDLELSDLTELARQLTRG